MAKMYQKKFFHLERPEGGMERNLAPGIDATIFFGAQAMISIARFQPSAKGLVHQHPEEQWGICQSGSGVRIQDGERISVRAGDFWLTPGGVSHGMEADEEGMVVIDIFAPPRRAYKTAGSGFGAMEE